MAGTNLNTPPRFFTATEAVILALTTASPFWFEYAFYYPTDKSYFYQALGGVLKKYGDGEADDFFAYGIKLNDKAITGVKTLIEETDVLEIPENYDYNTFTLNVEGTVNCEGQINIM